jgi:hypothetical protein
VRYDFTRDRLFSMADSTIKVLRHLSKDVKVTAFYPPASVEGKLVEDLLKEYKRYSDRFTYKSVDPFRDPVTTKAMNVRQPGTIVVQCEGNRKDIFDNEVFQRPMRMAEQGTPPKFTGEMALTSALINVTSGIKRRVQFVTGHNEPGLTSFNHQGLAGMQQFLVKENFDASEVSLMKGISTETTILALVNPRSNFHPDEIKVLKEFVTTRHGHLLVMMNSDAKAPDFESFLTETFGVSFNQEVILNPRSIDDKTSSIIVPQYTFHPIIKDQMENGSGVLMQECRGLSFETKENWTITAFLQTGADVYAKRRMEDLTAGKKAFDPQTDVRGPFKLGLAAEGKGIASGSRAVFLGDSDFSSNSLLQVQGNADLIINTVNWLAGQEQMISIRPRPLDFATVTLDKDDATRILVMCVVASPLLIVLLGGIVWMTRRGG